MDHKEKAEYYRTKLQEIVLFKSCFDNKLAEITEQAAADKWEVESLAKKYDERYKAAADVNTLTGSRRGKISRDSGKEDRYSQMCLSKWNMVAIQALFCRSDASKSHAECISTDLNESRKALHECAKHLGIEVKEKPPIETPFGQ